MPPRSGRSVSESTTAPPYAASTWSHAPTRSAISASALDRVDRRGAGRAGRRDDRGGSDAGCEVGGEQPLEIVHPHREPLVDCDLADGGLAEPEDVGGAIDREVRLLGRVDREWRPADTAVRAVVSARSRASFSAERLASEPPLDEVTACTGRKPEPVGEPAHQLGLDLGRRGGEHPAADVRVQPGGEEVGDRARHRASSGDVGEEAAAPWSQRVVDDRLRGARSARRRRAAPRAPRARRPRERSTWSRAGCRALGQLREERGVEVENPVAERPRALGRPVEVGDGRWSVVSHRLSLSSALRRRPTVRPGVP